MRERSPKFAQAGRPAVACFRFGMASPETPRTHPPYFSGNPATAATSNRFAPHDWELRYGRSRG